MSQDKFDLFFHDVPRKMHIVLFVCFSLSGLFSSNLCIGKNHYIDKREGLVVFLIIGSV